MADFEATTQVAAPASTLFDYLARVENLPRYVDRMTAAVPAGGEAVTVTARMPDGQEVQGEAWFRVDHEARTLAWGSEGPNDYSGRLEVTGDAGASSVTVHVSTARTEDAEVQDGVDATVARIRELVEAG